ncbi:MAG: hypothetical protein WCV62_03445 [Candidatus Peribacteraceae bacterium]|jgi:hypothetical protein
MLTHYRRRRSAYPVAPRPRIPRRLIATVIFVLAVAYFFGGNILRLFGFGGPIERLPATVAVEDRGTVTVTLDGEEPKRAENSMKLFAGEGIGTGSSGHATLRFFEGTLARLDQNSSLVVEESTREKDGTRIVLTLERGSLWVHVPDTSASGGTLRSLRTPTLTFTFPPGTEAIVSPSSILVFAAEGEGVEVSLPKHPSVAIGEGQKLTLPGDLPASSVKKDLYDYRTPLDTSTVQLALLTESRSQGEAFSLSMVETGGGSGSDILSVATPSDGQTLVGAMVRVSGTFGTRVETVKVNGYPAVLDREARTFTQDVSLPEGEQEFLVRIQAMDAEGQPLVEMRRMVKRGAGGTPVGAIPSPAITSPARSGETYRTQAAELILRGTSPAEAAVIYVNDYKLKLFTPSKGTWSYLAGTALGNMKPGTNTYDVIAEDAQGRRSAPVRITVIHGEGAEGVVGQGSASSASAPVAVDPRTLPTNDPTAPGTLRVTGDAAQAGFTATGTGFLLEGATSPQTATVWVNDYQLKLYTAGKTFWNYIASPDLKTLKEGVNSFTVIARDGEGKILDKMEVKVEYRK